MELLSYFEFHQEKGIVTYDDVENKISYFYGQGGKEKEVQEEIK